MKKLENGKSQFNVTSAKQFRETMAKWGNAQFDIAQEILWKNDRVKAHKTIMKSNEDMIAKLEKGGSIIGNHTIESLRADNVEIQGKIDAENAALNEYKKAQADRLTLGEKLVTSDLYDAYKSFSEDDDDDALYDAIADFLTANGVEPRHKTVTALVRKSGGDKVNSARGKVQSGNQNGANSKSVWTKIFLGALYDIMGDAVPKYKFTYVLKDKRKKSEPVKHTTAAPNAESMPTAPESASAESAPVASEIAAK